MAQLRGWIQANTLQNQERNSQKNLERKILDFLDSIFPKIDKTIGNGFIAFSFFHYPNHFRFDPVAWQDFEKLLESNLSIDEAIFRFDDAEIGLVYRYDLSRVDDR